MTGPICIIGLLVLCAGSAAAESQTFTSTADRVALLELYTSEGCSSCPPAEEWLSRLKDDPRLWKQLVPVAWHDAMAVWVTDPDDPAPIQAVGGWITRAATR